MTETGNGRELVRRFSGCRVAVIGDLMLDEYIWGRVSRISPEAPVPVVQTERYSCCLGGAANTVRNIVTLGGECVAFGLTGDDPEGLLIRKHLAVYGVSDRFVLCDPQRPTTSKRRIVAGTQQLLRVDHEELSDPPAALRRKLADALIGEIEQNRVQAVIFEDYGKGLLSGPLIRRILEAANRHGLITALDPKPGHLRPVPGLTVIKPNRQEALAMTGLPASSPLPRVAEKFLAAWQPKYLLISLSAEGMALCRPGQLPDVIPTEAHEVFDVSGAGDTVTATFTLALTVGASAEQAAKLANAAAGVVVAKLGTATVSAAELQEKLSSPLPGAGGTQEGDERL